MGCGFNIFNGFFKVTSKNGEFDANEWKKVFNAIDSGFTCDGDKVIIDGEKWKVDELRDTAEQLVAKASENGYALSGSVWCDANEIHYDKIVITIKDGEVVITGIDDFSGGYHLKGDRGEYNFILEMTFDPETTDLSKMITPVLKKNPGFVKRT